MQAIRRYFTASIQKDAHPEDQGPTTNSEHPKPKKTKQIYNIRDVIKQHYRNLVEEEIPYESKDPLYLGSYQKAVTTVLKNMSDEDLEEAQNILERWNKEGGPSDLQLK